MVISYKSPNMGYNYSYLTYNPTYNYPKTLKPLQNPLKEPFKEPHNPTPMNLQVGGGLSEPGGRILGRRSGHRADPRSRRHKKTL